MTATSRPTAPAARGRNVDWSKLAFLSVLLLVFAFYTEMAMGMEWRTAAGRIGPGFFPRILGVTALAIIVIAAAREIISGSGEEKTDQVQAAEEAAEPDLGRHTLALVAFVGAAALFVWLLGVLGAALAGVLFLGVTLWFLDREHHIRAVIIAVVVPIALYFALQDGLDVGLPEGILPLG